MTVLIWILIILAALWLFRAARLILKRCAAIIKLKRLAKSEPKLKLRFTRSPILGIFGMSEKPDAVIEIDNKIFMARFYNGRGSKTQVHFANEEYSATFSILMVRSLFGTRDRSYTLGTQGRAPESITTVRRRTKIVPKLKIPEEYRDAAARGKKITPVFVFNPAPSNVSYVSDEKTSIKLAFTGDDFRGTKIFTGTSFVRFLDRETRYL